MLYKLSKKQEETTRSLEKIERGKPAPINPVLADEYSLLRYPIEASRVWRPARDPEADGQARFGRF